MSPTEGRVAISACVGRVQPCGFTPLRGLLLSRRSFGRLANDALRILVFVLTDRCGDSVDIEVVRLANVLADSVQLLNDGVAPLHGELPDVGLRSRVPSRQLSRAHPPEPISANDDVTEDWLFEPG
jgi:hypothetical protein